MLRMKRTILAVVAAFAALVLGATAVSAAEFGCYFFGTWVGNTYYAPGSGRSQYFAWNIDTTPVVTVSDRSGYDLNEYEATYAWGSYAYDEISLAYTTAQTCTWCIRIVTDESAAPGVATIGYSESGYMKQCTIYVSDTWARNHLNASDRQYQMAVSIGHCIGFEWASATADSVMNNDHAVSINPTYTDYVEMRSHYQTAVR